jgi:hypothetical protein
MISQHSGMHRPDADIVLTWLTIRGPSQVVAARGEAARLALLHHPARGLSVVVKRQLH